MRLDQAMVARRLSRTRAQAREAILRGVVTVDGKPALRPSQKVGPHAEIGSEPAPYVGRGAHKLIHALDTFKIDVEGARALDVGASTGGFTEVLLRRGAAAVIALDVGCGQLAPSLRTDPRVTEIVGLNARDLRPEDLPFAPDVVVIDVSFISLRLVLPPVLAAAAPQMTLVALVKPQFEVGREGLGKGGIVRDDTAAAGALAAIVEFARAAGLEILGTTPSPIAGGQGNREWLLAAQRRS